MRSNRIIRTTTLAATALLAALSLTACTGDDGVDNGKSGASAPASSTTDQKSPDAATSGSDQDDKDAGSTSDASAGSSTGTSKGSSSGTNAQKSNTSNTGSTGNTSSTGTSGSTATSGKTGTSGNSSPVTCIGSNTKLTLSKVQRPINHMLLTMTNTGSRPCYAYYAPKLRFDDAQSVFPILDDSRPQAVVTLEPGQSAYASIGLSSAESGPDDVYKATRLTIYFSGKDFSGDSGTAPDVLKLPADTYWDDKGFVTYWLSDMADALTY
ncbi:DUF4232 domain-containing protein [Streptomyces sp. NPDC052052]|uniref:DUF4232 domain-containing protein n=1 Tax=Streptomyces sp. NPDC052052 TaxID=3154756 RepID=UPI00342D4B0B